MEKIEKPDENPETYQAVKAELDTVTMRANDLWYDNLENAVGEALIKLVDTFPKEEIEKIIPGANEYVALSRRESELKRKLTNLSPEE